MPNTAPLFTDFLYGFWPFDNSPYQLAGNERLPEQAENGYRIEVARVQRWES